MGVARILGVSFLLAACGSTSRVASSPIASVSTAAPTPAPLPSTSASAPPPASASASVPVAATPTARQLAQDETVATASGATLMVAKGWFVTNRGDFLVLEDPDRALKLALVEIAAADRDAAISGAWSRFHPGFGLPIARTVDLPARDGWDAVAQISYVTKPEEDRRVLALPRRKAATWYVELLDGNKAALDRRSAQVMIALHSLKVAGMEKESFAGRTAHPLDVDRQQQLATFIEKARQDVDIPGVAIGVVQGGKLVYEQGFGVKDRAAPKRGGEVGPATLFLIGSNTKSLTTLLMARLIDRGVFSWTTPLTQLLPSFALGNAEVTGKVTVEHTVCACTGLPRQDMELFFEYAGVTPEDRVASMKNMVPTTGFGETFQYSNTLVSTGGFIAAHALAPRKRLGPAYDEAMRAEVFAPLGMGATTFEFSRAARANHAAPHARGLEMAYRRIPLTWEEGVIAVRPAGGAWSNVRDISRYLLLELAKGVTPEGKRVVSETNLLHRRDPQAKITDEASYGLGLMVTTDHGVSVVQHGGNNLGYSSDMYLLPEHGIGVIVLTNAAGANAFLGAVRRRLFELLFDGKPEAAENLANVLGRDRKAHEELAAMVKPKIDPALLQPLLGEYRNAALGRLSLKLRGGQATLDAGEWQTPVAQKNDLDGSVKLITTAPGRRFELIPGEHDRKHTLTLKTAQQSYTFEPIDKATSGHR